jgi:hypothetical protein
MKDTVVSLSERDVSVLAALDAEGPIPMSDLFWRFFATDADREEGRRADHKKCDNRLRQLGPGLAKGEDGEDEVKGYGFLTIEDAPRRPRGDAPACNVPGCDEPVKSVRSGLCNGHYKRASQGLEVNVPLRRQGRKVCAITDLGRAQLRVVCDGDLSDAACGDAFAGSPLLPVP